METPSTASRDEILSFYSPFSFIRSIKPEKQVALVKKTFADCETHRITKEGKEISFLYKKLAWDTTYFGIPSIKLMHVLFEEIPFPSLVAAIEEFVKEVVTENNTTLFIEIPSEDLQLIQALGENGFKLLESRLTYFNDQLKKYDYRRFQVREAKKEDSQKLQEVAKIMRNNYDRFHADQTFPNDQADNYLATYIENSIQGFTDYVMVPNEPSVPTEAFLTANYLKNDWEEIGVNASKMVLSAVHASCKGWYVKLISEMTYFLRDTIGANIIFMNTQSTNKTVVKTWESLGYKYGNCVHVLSKNIQ